MTRSRSRWLVVLVLLLSSTVTSHEGGLARWIAPPKRRSFASTFDVSTFQKGNVHTHTDRSDGNDPPRAVAAWYRGHDYRFLAITDHNLWSDGSDLHLSSPAFRLIPGEEITMTGGGRQVHVNALCTSAPIPGESFATAADALTWGVRQVEIQGGVAVVNHPNFDHALSAEDLLVARSAQLLEIMSGHPYVFSEGTADRPSHEALWSYTLDHGLHLMGVAVDDTHSLTAPADPPAYPGKGWVEVFARTNEEEAICDALRRGRLYASTGVVLSRIRVTADSYAVWPQGDAVVLFIGRGDGILERVYVNGGAAVYALRGGESFVRARVEVRDAIAWTPAVFVNP